MQEGLPGGGGRNQAVYFTYCRLRPQPKELQEITIRNLQKNEEVIDKDSIHSLRFVLFSAQHCTAGY